MNRMAAGTTYRNSGFIHVPYALEQLPGKPEGTPGLALQQIAQGLSCAIEAIAEAWS